MSSAQNKGPPSPPPPSIIDQLLWFFVLPMTALFHLAFLWINSKDVVLNYGLFSLTLGQNWIIFNSFMYGACIVASGLYYILQQRDREISGLKKAIGDLTRDNQALQALKQKYKDTASKILMPYPLDQLVDKDLREFSNFNSQPGVMHCRTRE
eukprot:g9515.t1